MKLEETPEVLEFYKHMYKLIRKEKLVNLLKIILMLSVWFGGKGFVVLCATAPPSYVIYRIYKNERTIANMKTQQEQSACESTPTSHSPLP